MKKIIGILMTAGLMTTPVFGEGVFETQYSLSENAYVASGNVNGADFNGMVAFKVLDSKNNIAHIATIKAEADNSFKYSFNLDEELDSGYYKAAIGVYGDKTESESAEFFHASNKDKEKLFLEIKPEEAADAPEDAEDLTEIVEKGYNLKIIGVKENWYNYIEDEKSVVFSEVYSELSKIKNITDFGTNLEEKIAFAAVRLSTTQNIDEVVDEFGTYFLFEECEMYKKIQSSQFDMALDMLAGADVHTKQDIQKFFDENCTLIMLNSASTWRVFRDILQENIEHLHIDMTTYNKCDIDDLSIVLSENEEGYNTASEIYDAIDKYYNDKSEPVKTIGGRDSDSSYNIGGTAYHSITQGNTIENSKSFNDMQGYKWASNAVNYLSDKNIITGNGNGGFQPADYVTREQFVKMLLLAFNLYDDGYNSDFSDVSKSHWAYSYVSCADEKDIVNGMGNKIFGTGKNITRQDMAVLIERAMTASGIDIEEKQEKTLYDIDEVSPYAKKSVDKMIRAGIVNGYEDGCFKPSAYATRAEAAVMIFNAMRGE